MLPRSPPVTESNKRDSIRRVCDYGVWSCERWHDLAAVAEVERGESDLFHARHHTCPSCVAESCERHGLHHHCHLSSHTTSPHRLHGRRRSLGPRNVEPAGLPTPGPERAMRGLIIGSTMPRRAARALTRSCIVLRSRCASRAMSSQRWSLSRRSSHPRTSVSVTGRRFVISRFRRIVVYHRLACGPCCADRGQSALSAG